MREDELPHKRIICEAKDSIPNGQHEDCGGGIQAVAGSKEAASRLADIDNAV